MENLSLDERIALQEQCNRRPKGFGVNFDHFDNIDLNKIDQKLGNTFANQVREKGIDPNIVKGFESRIKEGTYLFIYDQPVVVKLPNGRYRLICGEHRYQAHKKLGLDVMFCAVVSFDNTESEILFQSNENDEENEFIQNSRTEGGVILTLTNLLNNGSITNIQDDAQINVFLGKLNQKTGDYPKLREEFRKEHGITSAVTTYESKDRAEWCQDNKPEVDFSTTVNGIAYLNKTFKGGKGKGGLRDLDYDPRCVFDAFKQLQKKEVNKVYVVGSFNKANAKKIKALRNYKETKWLKNGQTRFLKLLKILRKEILILLIKLNSYGAHKFQKKITWRIGHNEEEMGIIRRGCLSCYERIIASLDKRFS